jgi:hypothetical protein
MEVKISDLLGKTMVRVENNGTYELSFTADTQEQWIFYHNQDCCENVSIDDIVGDLSDLVGSPLLMAEEVSEGDKKDGDESGTWTFYKFATVKGYVTVKWYGSSNGYYSERVDLRYKFLPAEVAQKLME